MPISAFDVAGPIMVGPSSSHTAGACKIGQIARAIFSGTPEKATFYLHGSFAEVYQGHATDRALLAGVMRFITADPRLKDAFEIADKKRLKYEFITTDLGGDHHPNTVKIVLQKPGKKISVIGSSIGGGQIKITHFNDIPIDLDAVTGRFQSMIIGHEGDHKTLEPLIQKLREWKVPIARQKTCTLIGESLSMLSIEDCSITLPQVLELEKMPGIHFVRSLTKLLK